MAKDIKTTGSSYYDIMPPPDLGAGDIWTDLPAFGHLRKALCGGVVITPACDLSNKKVETVTYLPIITVDDYLLGRPFASELVRVIRAQGAHAGLNVDSWQLRGVALPELVLLSRR